jgi:peptidoglycan/LPS O-acetylase OafA/YrhL
MMKNVKKIDNRIQILRGISVIAVVLFHLVPEEFPIGFLGVDVFFVISGFLMAKLYGNIRTKAEISEFLKKRMWRLLPAYYFVLILTYVYSLFVLLPHELATLNQHIRWSLFLSPNVGYWTDSQYWGSAQFRPILNFWSLGVEIHFYLLFPLIVKYVNRSRLLALLASLNLSTYITISAFSEKSSFFLMPFRFWEFAMGMLAYRVSAQSLSRRISFIRFIAIFSSLLLLFLLQNSNPNVSVVLVAIATAAFLSRAYVLSSISRFLKPLEAVGDYSYSIYLVHYPILIFLFYIPFESSSDLNTTQAPTRIFLYLLFLIPASIFLRQLIEVKSLKNRFFVRYLSVSALFILALSLISPSTFGKISLNAREIKISETVLDYAPYRCGKLFRLTNPFGVACKLNDNVNEKSKILLIGDSHADMFKSPLKKFAVDQDSEFWLWRANETLSDSNFQKIKDFIDDERITRIIIASNNGGTDFIKFDQLMKEFEGLNRTWSYIYSTPTYPESIPKVMFGGEQSEINNLRLSREQFDSLRVKELNFVTQQSGNSKFRAIDLTDYFCPNLCLYERKGLPIYADSNHITQTEVLRLAPLLKLAVSD